MSSVGELVAAAVVDKRVWDAYGNRANDGVYLVGQPGPALPFVVFRAWKVPTGYVNEEFRLIGPSGRMIYRWGPEARRMVGSMDRDQALVCVPPSSRFDSFLHRSLNF